MKTAFRLILEAISIVAFATVIFGFIAVTH